MLMSPPPKAPRRLGQPKRRPNLHSTIAVPVALAYAALAASAPAQAGNLSLPDGVVLTYSDEALPGEGRPPSPGPTDPDGPSY